MRFETLRTVVSPTVRISVCWKETLSYENYDSILSVPDSYNAMYVYGYGPINVEFTAMCEEESKRMTLDIALEIVISEKKENDIGETLSFGNLRRLHSRIDPVAIHVIGENHRSIYKFTKNISEKYDDLGVVFTGIDFSVEFIKARNLLSLIKKYSETEDEDAEIIVTQALDLSRGTVFMIGE